MYLQILLFFFNLTPPENRRFARIFAIAYPVSLVASIVFALVGFALGSNSACSEEAYGTVASVGSTTLLLVSLVSLGATMFLFWKYTRPGAQHSYAGMGQVMPNSGRDQDEDSNNTAQIDKSPLKPKNAGPSEKKAEIEGEEPEEKAPAGGDDDIY